MILSGVMQECTLAGTCFAVSMGPFLVKSRVLIEHTAFGRVRACADDIGAALRSVNCLKPCANILRDAEAYAGLMLKIQKSFLAPEIGNRQRLSDRKSVAGSPFTCLNALNLGS